jgi:hypothetical protein
VGADLGGSEEKRKGGGASGSWVGTLVIFGRRVGAFLPLTSAAVVVVRPLPGAPASVRVAALH